MKLHGAGLRGADDPSRGAAGVDREDRERGAEAEPAELGAGVAEVLAGSHGLFEALDPQGRERRDLDTPALSMSTSIWPHSVTTRSTKRSASSRRPRSRGGRGPPRRARGVARPRPPRPRRARRRRRVRRAGRAPSASKRPSPRVPPLMMTTLPRQSNARARRTAVRSATSPTIRREVWLSLSSRSSLSSSSSRSSLRRMIGFEQRDCIRSTNQVDSNLSVVEIPEWSK